MLKKNLSICILLGVSILSVHASKTEESEGSFSSKALLPATRMAQNYKLPFEIWNHIFSFLPESDLQRIMPTCKQFLDISSAHVSTRFLHLNKSDLTPETLVERLRTSRFQLELLDVGENVQLRGTIITDILTKYQLPLISLNVKALQIEDEGLKALYSYPNALISLNLEYNLITREGVSLLSDFLKLTYLNLGGNKIENQGVKVLANTLTGLIFLGLRGNDLTDEGVCALDTLTALTELDLSMNRIKGEEIQPFCTLPSLTCLNLRQNKIGYVGVQALSVGTFKTCLTFLNLQNNGIKNEEMSLFSCFPALVHLDLSHNGIENKGIEEFASMISSGHFLNLERLSLKKNNGIIVDGRAVQYLLNDCPSLIYLNLEIDDPSLPRIEQTDFEVTGTPNPSYAKTSRTKKWNEKLKQLKEKLKRKKKKQQ